MTADFNQQDELNPILGQGNRKQGRKSDTSYRNEGNAQKNSEDDNSHKKKPVSITYKFNNVDNLWEEKNLNTSDHYSDQSSNQKLDKSKENVKNEDYNDKTAKPKNNNQGKSQTNYQKQQQKQNFSKNSNFHSETSNEWKQAYAQRENQFISNDISNLNQEHSFDKNTNMSSTSFQNLNNQNKTSHNHNNFNLNNSNVNQFKNDQATDQNALGYVITGCIVILCFCAFCILSVYYLVSNISESEQNNEQPQNIQESVTLPQTSMSSEEKKLVSEDETLIKKDDKALTVPVSKTLTLTGKGDMKTRMFNLKSGTVIYHFTNNSEGNFSVRLIDTSTSYSDINSITPLIVNLGEVKSSRVFHSSEGTFQLYVKSKGNWKIDILHPFELQAKEINKFEGKGSFATDVFKLDKGLQTFQISHQGDGNLVVKLYDSKQGFYELIINEIGNYHASHSLKVDQGNYLFDVEADGDWKIEIK